jgi:hypothetical protein
MDINALNSNTLANQSSTTQQQSVTQPQQVSPLEEVQKSFEEQTRNTQQQAGIEAFNQSLENDPTAQIISILV